MFHKKTAAVLVLVSMIIVAVSFPAQAGIKVAVSIQPQKYFVDKVGGDLVEVTVMVPPGASPHSYEPKPVQMAALAKADLYFTIGVEFEHAWMKKFQAANKNLVVTDSAAQVRRMPMTGSHGNHAKDKDDHDHQGLDPHIWLSPALVEIQAQAVRDGLAQADPASSPVFDRNLAAFKEEIRNLDRELREALQGLEGHKSILVFHPAWGYFCRDYGLTQVAVEKEGKEPTAKGLQALINQARG